MEVTQTQWLILFAALTIVFAVLASWGRRKAGSERTSLNGTVVMLIAAASAAFFLLGKMVTVTAPEESVPNTTVGAALNGLEVKPRGAKTGYSREQFGPSWFDIDKNKCDTRNDILARDLSDVVYQTGSRCVIASGVLHDPYGGGDIDWRRGVETSSAVQVDHVVALSDAWQKGAQEWSANKRLLFANDPLNLVAADGPLNMQKSDGDAATWLPPNKSYQCEYVTRQVAVKRKYGVAVTGAEKNAMARVVKGCPDVKLPTSSVRVG